MSFSISLALELPSWFHTCFVHAPSGGGVSGTREGRGGEGKGRGYVMPPSWLGKFDSYITYIYDDS